MVRWKNPTCRLLPVGWNANYLHFEPTLTRRDLHGDATLIWICGHVDAGYVYQPSFADTTLIRQYNLICALVRRQWRCACTLVVRYGIPRAGRCRWVSCNFNRTLVLHSRWNCVDGISIAWRGNQKKTRKAICKTDIEIHGRKFAN